jgi:hypothetical protein
MDKTLEDACNAPEAPFGWSNEAAFAYQAGWESGFNRAVEMAIRMAAQRVVDNHVGQSVDDECKGYPDDSAYNLALRHARDSILILLD